MTLLEKYIAFKANPDNDSKKDNLFCESVKCSIAELKQLKKDNPTWRKQCLLSRREVYAERMTEVDESLFSAAMGGDTRAADLLYRRFDGWDPKAPTTESEATTFAELAKAAANSEETTNDTAVQQG